MPTDQPNSQVQERSRGQAKANGKGKGSQRSKAAGKKKGKGQHGQQKVTGDVVPKMQLLSTLPLQPELPATQSKASSSSSCQPPQAPAHSMVSQGVSSQPSQPSQPRSANRRLWQQMAWGREELSNGGQPKGVPISTVWESIVGSRFQSKNPEDETKKGYVLPNHTGKECSLTNCEATSECSTVDTTTSWPVFSVEDEILAERIAAVLMDRKVSEVIHGELRSGGNSGRLFASPWRSKSMEFVH